MDDLIRRADVLAYPIRIDHYDKEHGNRHFVLGIESVMEYVESLPSVELVVQTPQTYGKSINPSNAEVVADYISRADAIEAVASADETNGAVKVFSGFEVIDILKALPSADAVDVTHDIPEYCSWSQTYTNMAQGAMSNASAEAVQGEWVRKYDDKVNCYWYECDQCGEYRPRNQFGHEYNANFCPNCGARMKGGDTE